MTNEQINKGLLQIQGHKLDSDVDSERCMHEFLYIEVVLRDDARRRFTFTPKS